MANQTNKSNQQDEQDGERKGVLSDFSMSQVIASALAAATSMLLTNRIGVIGGILGAAVGAGVAAIATQVYRSILQGTADKMANIVDARSSDDGTGEPGPDGDAAETTQQTAGSNVPASQTSRMTNGNVYLSDEETRKLADETLLQPAATAAPAQSRQADATRQQSVSSRHQQARIYAEQAKRDRTRRVRATVAIVAVALLAVILTAVVITWATNGSGLGSVPGSTTTAPITDQQSEQPASAPTSPATTDEAATTDTSGTTDESSDTSSTTDSTSTTDGSSSGSTDGSSTTDGSGSSSSSSSDSSSSSSSSSDSSSSSSQGDQATSSGSSGTTSTSSAA